MSRDWKKTLEEKPGSELERRILAAAEGPLARLAKPPIRRRYWIAGAAASLAAAAVVIVRSLSRSRPAPDEFANLPIDVILEAELLLDLDSLENLNTLRGLRKEGIWPKKQG